MSKIFCFLVSALVLAAACGDVKSHDQTTDAAIDAPSGVELTVIRNGTGTGTVTSAPAGISCGEDCTETYAEGSTVTLTASADSDATFVGWTGGGCTGTGACVVTLTAATTVTASFALNGSIVVTLAGNGAGSVASNPAGIACGSDCAEAYASGTTVTLTATPEAGSVFDGWTGACSGTDTCVISVTAASSVTATFTLTQHTLTVSRMGSGAGAVSSAPAGIDCGTDCAESYNYGTVVSLTPVAETGSVFAGWSGACSGTGACVVSMTAARAVTATFHYGCVNPTFATVDIYGSEHVGFNYVDGQSWRDSFFRAYNNPPNFDITSWVGFNLSSIPNNARITAMSFNAYAQAVYVTPSVRLQYSTGNHWTAATVAYTDLPRTNLEISAAFVPTLGAYNTWNVDLASQSFAADLVDDWLTLGVDNSNATYSYAYFSGVAETNRPYVRISYSYCPCTNTTVTINGSQIVDFNYGGDMSAWRDNSYFRAYNSPPSHDLSGWVLFNLSSIPDTATISAMSFNAFATTVQSSPTVRLQYSSGNNWTSATVAYADLPRVNAEIAAPYVPTVNAYNAWSVPVGILGPDQADDWLTLGVDNSNSTYSYAYFNGPATAQPPYISVTYCN